MALLKVPITYDYPIRVLSPSTFKVYSIVVLQMKKSRVQCDFVELSYNQIVMKTGMSYMTIARCIDELSCYPDIIEVTRKSGVTTVFKPNKSIIL